MGAILHPKEHPSTLLGQQGQESCPLKPKGAGGLVVGTQAPFVLHICTSNTADSFASSGQAASKHPVDKG